MTLLNQFRTQLNFDASVDADADVVNGVIETNIFLPSINARVNADGRCERALSSAMCMRACDTVRVCERARPGGIVWMELQH